MLVSEAAGRKVVSVSSAETVGLVDEFLIDPVTKSVAGVSVRKAADGDVLRWADLTAFGADAVTVSGADKITAMDGKLEVLADKKHRPLGKLVLSSAGDALGSVDDIDFDADTGAVTAFQVGGQSVDGQRLIGIGTYAVVVRAAG